MKPIQSKQPESEAARQSEGAAELPESLLHHQHLLFNRELSWLEFNSRVLEEALNETQPLLERLKFLAIFSTNLDEFFMIRVSGLKEELEEEISELSPDGRSPVEQLKEISERLRPMVREQTRCLSEDILPKLKEQGIIIASYAELTAKEKTALSDYFLENIFPVLTPQAVDPSHPFPYISNLSLNLGMMIEPLDKVDKKDVISGDDDGRRFARVKIPPLVPRLVPVGESGSKFTLLGEVVSANINALFPGMSASETHLFRVTRDADIEIREDEASDLLRVMEQQLRRRRFGDAVRLEVSAQMPVEMVTSLTESLELTPDDVYSVEGLLNIPDLMALHGLDRPELKDKPLQTFVPAAFAQGGSVFDAIRQQDILVHHPYTSYSTVVDFIQKAAIDPDVLAIKICLYRTGQRSPIVPALIEASEQGKQVAALVELKARFDEENNIGWARRLERAGVHVVYGMLGLKTHCKLALIVRREGKQLRRYVHIATGNYNPTTSRLYTDIGLFTSDDQMGADATDLFNYLTGYSRQNEYRQLLVAPVNLREGITELIEREAEHARNGRKGRIVAKTNSLTDIRIIRALYEASQAGVKIDLIVRGICMLRPGVPGVSENIRVVSVVGRFLEHSRIFYFGNDGEAAVYIGSADWMQRNLDRRVEVIAPVSDESLQKQLKGVLEIYLRDNTKARQLLPDGTYERVRAGEGEEPFDSQTAFQQVRW